MIPRGPKGERRSSHVIGNAVHVMRVATGEIEDTKATPRTEAPKGRLEGRQSPPRHDPIRVFAKEVHRQNAAKAGRTITDHLMVRAKYLRSIARSIVRGRESAPDSGARPQISRSKPQAANLVGSTSSILSELTIGIARGFMASGTSRTRSM